jgi:hypothetical protein
MSRRVMPGVLLFAAFSLVATSPAAAQGQPPGTVTFSAAATGIYQFGRDLDAGGTAQWDGAAISGSVMRQMVPAFAAGLSVRHAGERWRIDSPAAFGGQPPWRDLRRSSVGLNLSLALSHTLLVGLSPVAEWASETGASSGDALTYGAVASAVKVLGPGLTLGAGASVTRQFYSVKVSPFAIVNWKVTDRIRIANAIPAGPEGGAGIEARWTPAPDWELAAGGVIRSDRYRLADDAAHVAFIGETSSIPVFARLSRKLGPTVRADLYAGVLANGRLQIKDTAGNKIASTDDAMAPAIALTVSFKH